MVAGFYLVHHHGTNIDTAYRQHRHIFHLYLLLLLIHEFLPLVVMVVMVMAVVQAVVDQSLLLSPFYIPRHHSSYRLALCTDAA